MEQHRLLGLSPAGFHALSYTLWRPSAGEEGAPHRVVICVHGLTRNGRDFDSLAGALAEAGFLVVCPDMIGRGKSDWLAAPEGYGLPQYCADVTSLIARLRVERVDWVGTSMGGLIGMTLAAQASTPLGRLVLNDVGPFIPQAAIARIASYAGTDPRFADLAEAEAYLREIHAPFGLSDDHWRHLAEHSVRPAGELGGDQILGEGSRLRLHYDPAILTSLGAEPFDDVNLWPVWDKIEQDVLVLRGAESDLLLAETTREMAARGPRAEVAEIPGCGHAPGLMDPQQIALVRDWLLAGGYTKS
jgi:pimeloyl-ACP methyl ester carboxylesterase